jgi:hypothetical protein
MRKQAGGLKRPIDPGKMFQTKKALAAELGGGSIDASFPPSQTTADTMPGTSPSDDLKEDIMTQLVEAGPVSVQRALTNSWKLAIRIVPGKNVSSVSLGGQEMSKDELFENLWMLPVTLEDIAGDIEIIMNDGTLVRVASGLEVLSWDEFKQRKGPNVPTEEAFSSKKIKIQKLASGWNSPSLPGRVFKNKKQLVAELKKTASHVLLSDEAISDIIDGLWHISQISYDMEKDQRPLGYSDKLTAWEPKMQQFAAMARELDDALQEEWQWREKSNAEGRGGTGFVATEASSGKLQKKAMDPDAALQRIEEASSREEEEDAIRDLAQWINSGGFAPDWSRFPRATEAFNEWRRGGMTPEQGGYLGVTPTPIR